MSAQTLQILTLLTVILVTGFLLWQGKGVIDAAAIVKAVKTATPLAHDLALAAERAVMATEQYKREGLIVTNDEQLAFAIKVAKTWIPATRAYTDEEIIIAIKSFVPLASALTAQINAAKPVPVVVVQTPPLPPSPEGKAP